MDLKAVGKSFLASYALHRLSGADQKTALRRSGIGVTLNLVTKNSSVQDSVGSVIELFAKERMLERQINRPVELDLANQDFKPLQEDYDEAEKAQKKLVTADLTNELFELTGGVEEALSDLVGISEPMVLE